MATKCAIVPQIWHKGLKVDSMLFTQLWDKAKAEITDSIEARNKAKADYASIFTPAFRLKHGDWLVHYQVTNNLITTDFRLEDTSWLNEQGEPKIDVVLSNYVRLYRSESEKDSKTIPDWLRDQSEFKDNVEAEGRWFYKSLQEAKDHANKFGTSGITYVDVLDSDVEIFNAKDNKFAGGYGRDGNEYFVDSNIALKRKQLEEVQHSEPLYITAKQGRYNTLHGESLPDADRMFFNRSLSKIVISEFGKLSDLRTNQQSVKNIILTNLNIHLSKLKDEDQYRNLENIINRIKIPNSRDWAMFVGYLNAKFDIKIDKDAIEDEEGSRNTSDAVTREWDDAKQLQYDITKTASAELKFELAKSVYNQKEQIIVYTKEGTTDWHGNEIRIGEDSIAAKYGMLPAPDMDMIWHQIVGFNTENSTKESIIKATKLISRYHFDGAMDSFIDRLESDEEFYNLFYRVAGLAVVHNESLSIDKSTEDTSVLYESRQNNRTAFPSRMAHDSIVNAIKTKFAQKGYKGNTESILAILNTPRNDISSFYTGIQDLAKEIGIKIELAALVSYVNMMHGTDVSISMYGIIGLDDLGINDATRKAYMAAFRSTFEKLSYIADGILATQGETTANYGKKIKRIPTDKKFKATIGDIATITAVQYVNRVNMSMYNASGEREYSMQLQSYLTDMFKGLVSQSGTVLSQEVVTERFKDFTNDPLLYNDNLLWAHPDLQSTGLGIFYYKDNEVEDDFGTKRIVRQVTGINKDFIKGFILKQFGGNTQKNSRAGNNYRDIRDDNWISTYVIKMLEGTFLLPVSDSSREYGITRRFMDFRTSVPVTFYSQNTDKEGNIYNNGLIGDIVDVDNVEAFKSSTLYKMLYNVFKQEFTDIDTTFKKIFDYEHFLATNEVKLNHYYVNNGTASLHQLLEAKQIDGKSVAIKNGQPTGNVFNLSNFTFIKNGKQRTLKDAIEEEGYDYIKEVILYMSDVKTEIPNKITGYLIEWMQANQLDTIKSLTFIKDDLLNAKKPKAVAAVKSREVKEAAELTRLLNQDEYGYTVEDEDVGLGIASTTDLIPRLKKGEFTTSDVKFNPNSNELKTTSFNIAALEIFLNDFINTVSFGNLLYGNISEFKIGRDGNSVMVDWNKRVNHTIRNGSSTTVDSDYRMLVMQNVELKDDMLTLLDHSVNGNLKQLAEIKESYKKMVDTSNAIDIITDDELIRRFKAFGIYQRYKKIIDDIRDESKDFNYKQYDYLIEQLKYFGYSRQSINGGRVTSYQNKNSTIVVFKRFVKGTEKEQLYDFMKKHNIHDINTSEGFKVGGITPFRLHKEDGTIDEKQLALPIEDIEASIITQKHKDLRIQLETVPHLEDEEGRIATQLVKKIMNSITNKTFNPADGSWKTIKYTVNGKSFNGITGSMEDGKRGVFEDLQYSLSYNVEESAMELLADFGALKNGKIQYDAAGNIIVDIKRVKQIIEDYFMDSSTDLNLLKAVEVKEDGTTNVPYHHPTLLKLIENILEAKITNRVTRQKLNDIHVPIAPDLFNSFKIKEDGSTDTHISYTTDYLEQVKKTGDTKLKSDYWDAEGTYHPAQLLLNPHDEKFWLPEFLDERGLPDINKIKASDPKALLLFGIRIPNEGAQSSFVAEIVGFLHTGASQAITPDHLIARTGWDFDMDTVYMYKYSTHLERTYKDGKLDSVKIKADNINDVSEKAINKRIDNYIRVHYPDQYVASYGEVGYKLVRLYEAQNQIYDADKANKDDKIQKTVRIYLKNLDAKIARKINTIERIKNGESQTTEIDLEQLTSTLEQDIKERGQYIIEYEKVKILEEAKWDDTEIRKQENIIKRKRLANLHRMQQEAFNLRDSYFVLREHVSEEFEGLDNIKQSTRAERNNNIIDHFIAIHSHPTNTANKEKPNEMGHIASVSNYINNITGLSTKNSNPNNFADKLYFRNLNMNIAMLKTHSVSYDNVLSILSILGANTSIKVPAVIKFSEIKDFPTTVVAQEKILKSIFGKDNYAVDDTNKLIRIHNIGLIGNNKSMNGMDIQGELISKQRSELTSNILDAVKQLMINLTDETFGIFAFLASTPLSYNTNIHTGGEAEVNRFIYPGLFVSQPIVQELAKTININTKFGDRKSGKYNIDVVKERYIRSILETEGLTYNTLSQDIEKFFDNMSNNYTPSAIDIIDYNNAHSEEGTSLYSADDVMNKIREEFKNSLDTLVTYNNKNRFETSDPKEFIGNLNRYLSTINGAQFIQDVPMTLDELKSNIEEQFKERYILENINYNVNQLSVLLHYETISKAANAITSLIGVLNTDKKGVSPNSEVTNDFFNRVAKLEMNYDKLKEKFLSPKHRDIVQRKRAIRHLDSRINGANDLLSKVEIIREFMDENGFKQDLFIASVKDIDGQSIVSAVYGDLLTKENPDYKNSKYPYLNAQAIWSNLLSTKVFNDLLLSERPIIKQFINDTLFRINGVGDDYIRNNTILHLINKNVWQLDFFKYQGKETTEELDTNEKIEYANLLGIVKPRKVPHEEKTTITALGTKIVTPAYDELVWDMPEHQTISDLSLRFKDAKEQVAAFRKLSIANQVELHKELGLKKRFVEDRVVVNRDEASLKSNGFLRLSINDSEADINETRDAFRELYNGNIYDRIVADNLIRYAFITKGLQFGVNIGKFIPIDIFYEANRNNDLHKMISIQDNVDHLKTQVTEDIIDDIHKAQWNSVKVNPLMEASYFITDKGKSIDNNRPKFNIKAENTKDVEFLNHLILEDVSKIDNSIYVNQDYLIKNIKLGNTTFPVLYKRHDVPLLDKYIYYPINRTLPFEYGTTVVANFKSIPVDSVLEEIQDPSTYLGMLSKITVKGKSQNILTGVTKQEVSKTPFKGYTVTATEMSNNSDITVHIGSKDSFEGGVSKGLKHSIVISEEDFIKKGVNLSKFDSKIPKRITIANVDLAHPRNIQEEVIVFLLSGGKFDYDSFVNAASKGDAIDYKHFLAKEGGIKLEEFHKGSDMPGVHANHEFRDSDNTIADIIRSLTDRNSLLKTLHKLQHPELYIDNREGMTRLTILGDTSLSDTSDFNKGNLQNAIVRLLNSANFNTINTIVRGSNSIGKLIQESDLYVEKNIIDINNEFTQDASLLNVIKYAANSPDEEFMMILAQMRDSQIDIFEIATRLVKSLQYKPQVAGMDDLESIVNIAKDQLKTFTGTLSIEDMRELNKHNQKIYDFISNRVTDILAELEGVATDSFLDDSSFTKHKEYRRQLITAYSYIQTLYNMVDMPTFDISNLDTNDAEVVANFNAIAEEFAEKNIIIQQLEADIMHRIKLSGASELIQKSRNVEGFRESVYAQTVEYIQSEGFNPNDFPDIRVSQMQLEAVIKRMMEKNEDIGLIAAQLDSARDTAIPFMDIMGKVYAETLFHAQVNAANQRVKLNELLDDIGVSKDIAQSGTRAAYFKTKFLDSSGNLIKSYDFDALAKSREDIKKQLDILDENRQKVAHYKIEPDPIVASALKAQYDSLTKSIKSLAVARNNMIKKVPIVAGTTEYQTHLNFYLNNNRFATFKYANDNLIKFSGTLGRRFNIYKIKPADEFLSAQFKALTEKEQDFLVNLQVMIKGMVGDVFTGRYVSNTFLPYQYDASLETKIKHMFGWQHIVEDTYTQDVTGEQQYVIESRMLQSPRARLKQFIPPKLVKETYQEHEKRALAIVNARGHSFTSLKEVGKYNKEQYKIVAEEAALHRNGDIVNLMHNFISDMAKVKTTADFEAAYKMELIILGNDEFKAGIKTAKGNIIDRVRTSLNDEFNVVSKRGKDTRAYKRAVAWGDAIYGKSRITTKLDVALNTLLRNTSLITMGFNIKSGIKNAMAGYVNIATEAHGDQYFSKTDLLKASETYRKAIPNIIASIGKHTTINLTTGIVKYFHEIYFDVTEAHQEVNTGMLSRGLQHFDTLAYMALQSGEHMLQFTTLFAMLESHRVVGTGSSAQFMNLSDFIGDRRLKVLSNFLTEDQVNSLEAFTTKARGKEFSSTNYVEVISKWFTAHAKEFDSITRKNIVDAIKEENKIAEEQFNTFETLKDQFILDEKDGVVRIKEGSLFTDTKAGLFADRIRTVNHSLQGIYNTIDRSALQNHIVGELLLQFKKWARPTYIRWFGLKWGKSTYSEAMGNYRSGAYGDLRRFIGAPLIQGINNAKDLENPIIEAVRNIGIGYMDFLGNVKFYYHLLPPHQQANVRRSIAQIAALTLFSTLIYAAMMAAGGDDDKERGVIMNNIIYALSGTQSEIYDTTLPGWLAFIMRTKKTVAPAERTITDLTKAVYYTMVSPITLEQKRVYETGIYKGESKAAVNWMKVIPGLRQVQNMQHLESTINYYQMYNPLYNAIGASPDNADIKPQSQIIN